MATRTTPDRRTKAVQARAGTRKAARQWTARARLLVECLDLERASGVKGARWERFQIAHLNDDGRFRAELKSRQIAWSWLSAAEGMASAIVDQEDTVFVSINEEEAKEKIRYARAVYEALETPFVKPRIIRDSQTSIELEGAGGGDGPRLLSLPSKPVRGKARMNVVFDELAHVKGDGAIYAGSLPVITKGGRVRMGTSPLGASGTFWEIFTESLRPYPRYVRSSTPWYHVRALVGNASLGAEKRDALFRRCLQDAHLMTTAERVMEYGSEAIQELYDSMPEDSFRQEFECVFLDDAEAWITWPEIQAAQDPYLTCLVATVEGEAVADARLAIAALVGMVDRGEVERALAVGVDVGRTRNATEITIVGRSAKVTKAGPGGHASVRLTITMNKSPFPAQFDVLARLIRSLPIVRCLIDKNGLGRQLAEDLEQTFPGVVEGVDFTNAQKLDWATRIKVTMQKRQVSIPVDRDMAYQLHSIKRKVTASKALVFDTERNEKHHADKFWALALALAASPDPTALRDETVEGSIRPYV